MIDKKDVVDILNGDGIIDTNRETFSKYENVSSINLEDLRKDYIGHQKSLDKFQR